MGTVIQDRSQEDRIERLLIERGDWVSALDLSAISLQYCRAINGLRKRGLQIENKVEMRGKTRCGFYRIRREVVQVELIPASQMETRWHDPEEHA